MPPRRPARTRATRRTPPVAGAVSRPIASPSASTRRRAAWHSAARRAPASAAPDAVCVVVSCPAHPVVGYGCGGPCALARPVKLCLLEMTYGHDEPSNPVAKPDAVGNTDRSEDPRSVCDMDHRAPLDPLRRRLDDPWVAQAAD